MTQLNDLINKHIDNILFNGCELSKEMLTLMFDGVVALAKLQESFEINQRYLESIGTAFGNGGNDQVERILEEFNPTQNKPIEVIGQHITEPESIKPEQMVKGNWYFIANSTDEFIFKFDYFLYDLKVIHYFLMKNISPDYGLNKNHWMDYLTTDNIRPATIEEVTKYFPNEFDSNVTEHPNKY